MDLLYKVGDSGNVVFAERDRALYAAQLYEALTAETWGEFREKLPEGGWEEFLEKFGGDYEDSGEPVDNFPQGGEPFHGSRYSETGYPEWLAATELQWFPENLVEQFDGFLEFGLDNSSLYLPGEKAEEIADALRALGHTVEPSPVDII